MHSFLPVFSQFPNICAGFIGKPLDFSTESLFLKESFNNVIWNRGLQVHGIIVAEASEIVAEADGMCTTQSFVGCHARMADCIVGLFYDESTQEIAAIHSGWKGVAQNIFGKYISKFSNTTVLHVALSPSLGFCCAEFTDPFLETPDFFHAFVEKRGEKYFVDLWSIAKNQLQQAGVLEQNISMPVCCSACSSTWWSHRRKEPQRNVGFIFKK